MVDDLLKQGRLEEADDSVERADVPHNAGPVAAGTHGLVVIFGDLDGPDTTAVLLHGGFHGLALLAETEDTDFAFGAAGDHAAAVGSERQGGDAVEVGVVDDVHQTAGLRVEGADFAVVPATENALAVGGKSDAVAFDVGHLNSEQFLSIVGVPDADVGQGAGGEDIGVPGGESDVVDFIEVARVAQFGGQVLGVHPVDVGKRGAAEEMAVVSSKGHRGYFAHHIGFAFINVGSQ